MLRILMLLAAMLVLAPYISAEPAGTYQPQDRQEEQSTKIQTRSVVGTIVAIDPVENEITIRDKVTNETDSYKFNDATTFHKNDSDIEVDGLAAGDEISLEVESDGDLIVQLNSPSIVPIQD